MNPLEKCNLKCKICYTKKTSPILSNAQILAFIDRYQDAHKLQTVTYCGGEVFALQSFPDLVNQTVARGAMVQVITNGTLDQLDLLAYPNRVNLIVSLDGLEEYHDANRGLGNFQKSIAFLQKAQRRGFHTEVFSIVTKQNYLQLNNFEEYLQTQLSQPVEVTYHPRKPPAYLDHHPVSNITGETEGFDFLSDTELVTLMKEKQTFPPKQLGCYQLGVMSDGKVYGCCEGITPLGVMDDEIADLLVHLRQRLIKWERENTLANCLGCSQPEFVCGIKRQLFLLQN
ncbi:MAG: radical SAM protein [Pseudomonadales bacterium]|nr:radical SAM protein [Pseudomonadales bacterium]